MYKTYKRKIKLNKLSRKIKRLVKIHGKVKLEVFNGGGRNAEPYGMRYMDDKGNCFVHYANDGNRLDGRGRQKSCFFENYSRYSNDDGDVITVKSLDDTLRAMQRHDGRHIKIKAIHANGKKIVVK